jgi:hypothetical protein
MSETAHGRAFYEAVNAALPDGWRIVPAGKIELRLYGPVGTGGTIEQPWLSDELLLAEEAPWGAVGVLDLVQHEIAEETMEPWPARSGRQYRGFPNPHARLDGDDLRMWFGEDAHPVLMLDPVDLADVLLRDETS